jgi:hypothetical protein
MVRYVAYFLNDAVFVDEETNGGSVPRKDRYSCYATNGTTTIDFTYDHQGRLVKKDNGTNGEVYLYDGWNRIASFDASNLPSFTLAKQFLWGLDLGGSIQAGSPAGGQRPSGIGSAGGVGGSLKRRPTVSDL